jgi:hypothetical protein
MTPFMTKKLRIIVIGVTKIFEITAENRVMIAHVKCARISVLKTFSSFEIKKINTNWYKM